MAKICQVCPLFELSPKWQNKLMSIVYREAKHPFHYIDTLHYYMVNFFSSATFAQNPDEDKDDSF